MLAGRFYPLNKGVAALRGGGILFKEKISDMACLSPNKKWGMASKSLPFVFYFIYYHTYRDYSSRKEDIYLCYHGCFLGKR
ncbi:MAG: hypothetical protein Q8O92_13970 [Candidatus Latescibacter sp.]|nr:hypothetical protein [Candidatus Latescibacter sp.]